MSDSDKSKIREKAHDDLVGGKVSSCADIAVKESEYESCPVSASIYKEAFNQRKKELINQHKQYLRQLGQ